MSWHGAIKSITVNKSFDIVAEITIKDIQAPSIIVCSVDTERERIIDLCIQAGLKEWTMFARGTYECYPNVNVGSTCGEFWATTGNPPWGDFEIIKSEHIKS